MNDIIKIILLILIILILTFFAAADEMSNPVQKDDLISAQAAIEKLPAKKTAAIG